jgi:hypothetical protein
MDANGFRAKREAVRSLVETAREYVSVRHVYLNRGFYQVHVVAELEELGVDYIIRARPSSGMKDRLSASAETVVDAYTMQRKRKPTASVDVTVFAVPHRSNDDEYVWFVTSLDVDASTAKAYAAAFRRRWGIKTSYRQIGDFLPRTSCRRSQCGCSTFCSPWRCTICGCSQTSLSVVSTDQRNHQFRRGSFNDSS